MAAVWANRIVLLLFVLIYATAVELIRVFGMEPLKHVFFGIGHDLSRRSGRHARQEREQ